MRANSAGRRSGAPARTLGAVGDRVDVELRAFLDRQRGELAALHPDAALLVDEIVRLVDAGGKRVRPVLCYWGYRAAGGDDGRDIVLAAAALELLHTFAIVHDDVMDASDVRRGVAAAHEHAAAQARRRGVREEAAHVGISVAIIVGDLAAVYADRLLLESGFTPNRIIEARRRYDEMRVEMAAGQILDIVASPIVGDELARRVAALKTGSYTIEGPLALGAILAGGSADLRELLARYARPLGEAFQARDDLDDLDAFGALGGAAGIDAASEYVDELVDQARSTLDGAGLPGDAMRALHEIAELVAIRGEGPGDRAVERPAGRT